ncbi:LysR family transcriptional regulator [Lentzea sp. E54]|uniref:LysR family transcriptional regulator n=1 Tax=Lentzea xerophila TaxID=3435883 RepID=UPI003DA323CA
MEIEVRHARVVTTLVQAGSISKAAGMLNLPQPSVSALLRRIERTLGGDLFVRSKTGITPTLFGQRLIPKLARLVLHADDVLAEALAGNSNVLRFGNAEWTPTALHEALQKSLSDLRIQTATMSPHASVEAVYGGTLTAALVPVLKGAAHARMSEPVLASKGVTREPVWLALPSGHPLTLRDTATLADLAKLTWVRRSAGDWFHPVEQWLFNQLKEHSPVVLHYVCGHAEAMSWVRDAGAACLVAPGGIGADVGVVGIADAPVIEFALTWRRGSVHPQTLRRLVETIREYHYDRARATPRYWSFMVENAHDFPGFARYLRTAEPK